MKLSPLALLAALAIAPPAFAADTAQATLKAPASTSNTVLDGRVWRCDGAACVGVAPGSPASQPAVQECRRVAKTLGPIAAYSTGGRTLDAAALDACNR